MLRTKGGAPGRPSFLDRLRSQETAINNPRDAEQLFRQILKYDDAPEQIVLLCDAKLQPALASAVMTLQPNIAPVVRLLAALGAEKLSHGVFKSKALLCFCTIYEASGFTDTVLAQLAQGTLGDPAAIAWSLVKLAQGVPQVHDDPTILQIVDLLRTSKAAGATQLATMFASVKAPPDLDRTPATDQGLVSLQAAKAAMRPPGVRDHDNDKADFRQISIIPTPKELDCSEQPYLPPPEGSEFIDNKEAAMLDRHFRLMREDLLGPMRKELREEVRQPARDFRRLYKDPALVGIGFKPEPHVLLRVAMTPRLAGRVRSMGAKEAKDYFADGPGHRVFRQDTLVVLLEDVSPAADAPTLRAIAVGVVVERRGLVPERRPDEKRPGLELHVGISFMGSSMANLIPSLQGLPAKGVRVASYMFNAEAAFFTYEPVLRALQEMDSIPFGGVLAHLQPPGPLELPHAGRQIEDLSAELQAAVESDATQKEALQLALDSQVVLVQGPPGTGKTYIGVQMVKAMVDADAQQQGRGPPVYPAQNRLQILCLCYTNHALDSFLEALLDAGIPANKFIRLGNSPKISERLKPRCLRVLEEAKFTPTENRAFAGLKQQQTELEVKIEDLRCLFAQSIWGRSLQWWQSVESFLEDEDYEAYEQLKVDRLAVDGFQVVGPHSRPMEANYLWERWCNGQDRGILQEGGAE